MLLLYGIPLQRIIELTRAHLVEATDIGRITGFSVSLGSPVIEVPPNLGRLLAALPAETASRGTPLIAARPDAPRWLFPGRGTRGHLTYTGITARLRAHGISARQSRNAALIGLASDLPAPVICDLFGLSIAASVKWARRAARDWAGYLSIIEQRERSRATGAVRSPFPQG